MKRWIDGAASVLIIVFGVLVLIGLDADWRAQEAKRALIDGRLRHLERTLDGALANNYTSKPTRLPNSKPPFVMPKPGNPHT